jgi:hypothetical protein
MSLSQETVLELMALADGELDGEARARAEKLIEESDEARQVVESMRSPAIGAWLDTAMAGRADEAGADHIVDAVMRKVDAREEDGGVVRLADARAKRASRAQVAVAGVCAVLALAAGIVLYVRSVADSGADHAPVASATIPQVDIEPTASMAAQAPTPKQAVEVDEIDSPSRGVSVFEIPAGGPTAAAKASPPSVVIWIDDEEATK